MADYTFRIQMNVGQDMRHVEADGYKQEDPWLIFYRKPAEGGTSEYWRVKTDCVVSMETKRTRGKR
ncbi:hypothetical protein SPHFLASMR4Y_01732 [Sphingorhabdus sp. SMR4y]|nr:hypothetical protein SPHFLASMR4Y_01732 [Sphingorhabdus sp. SMR4y]